MVLAALAMVALQLGGCTLIVASKLSSADAGVQPAADSGSCADQGFDDDSLDDGGGVFHLDSGVGGPFAFHGRAWVDPGADGFDYAPSVAVFASDAGLIAVANLEVEGRRPGLRFSQPLAGVRTLSIAAGHYYNTGSPCGEVMAVADVPFDTTAALTFWSAGCSDPEIFIDAGVYSSRTVGSDTGIGWSSQDGGVLGIHLAGTGLVCAEEGGTQNCSSPVPNQLVGDGPRSLEGMVASGALVWATATPGHGVVLQSTDFASGPQLVSVPSGAVVPLRGDIALGLEFSGSRLNARVFNSAGLLLGDAAQFDTGSAANPSTLAATTYGTTLVRVAWVGTDGLGRVLDIDASDPANLHVSPDAATPRVVCGGQVRFVAPMSSKWVVVAAGEGLAVRPAP